MIYELCINSAATHYEDTPPFTRSNQQENSPTRNKPTNQTPTNKTEKTAHSNTIIIRETCFALTLLCPYSSTVFSGTSHSLAALLVKACSEDVHSSLPNQNSPRPRKQAKHKKGKQPTDSCDPDLGYSLTVRAAAHVCLVRQEQPRASCLATV